MSCMQGVIECTRHLVVRDRAECLVVVGAKRCRNQQWSEDLVNGNTLLLPRKASFSNYDALLQ